MDRKYWELTVFGVGWVDLCFSCEGLFASKRIKNCYLSSARGGPRVRKIFEIYHTFSTFCIGKEAKIILASFPIQNVENV